MTTKYDHIIKGAMLELEAQLARCDRCGYGG